MPHKKEPQRPKRAKYLGKMEDFLKSLHDLEADLIEALTDLDQRPEPARMALPAREVRPASTNSWDWAPPDESRRRPAPPAKRGAPNSPVDQRAPLPLGRPTRHHRDLKDSSGTDGDEDFSELYSGDDSSGYSCTYDASDSTDLSGHSGSDQSPHPTPPPTISCGNQVIVNGQLEIPECKPDAEAILRFKPVCRVSDWQVVHTAEGRKIVVTGVVEIGVEYVANLPDQPMHFVHFVVPFHTFFLCSRPLQGIRCDVEFKHSELLNPRTISKVVLLSVRGVEEK